MSFHAANGEISLMMTGFLVMLVWRFTFVLMFLSYLSLSLLGEVFVFLYKGGPSYRWEALPLVLVPAVVLAFGWWRHRAAESPGL